MTDTQPGPLIVQGDHTVLLEVDHPQYARARDQLARFAELVKSPEHIHTYRVTPLSVWNARAAGLSPEEITAILTRFARYPVPGHVATRIQDFASRYGRLRITRDERGLLLTADEAHLSESIGRNHEVAPYLRERLAPTVHRIEVVARGHLKQALVKIGFPAEDRAGYTTGEPLPLRLRTSTEGQHAPNAGPPSSARPAEHAPNAGPPSSARPAERQADGPANHPAEHPAGLPPGTEEVFRLRPYQADAAAAFYAGGSDRGGSGVIVLPCGAGKTIVGLACMAKVQTNTLILTTSVTAIDQWRRELLEKTTLREHQIGAYHGRRKDVRPVTLATYNIMTYRKSADAPFPHLDLFDSSPWGLIIYDEVHLLPAPVFQITASLQARRRLGLTATLVREDGREEDVFALIGPKKTDVPWRTIERQGWIAQACCTEVRVELPEPMKMTYALADARHRFRIAAENPRKQAIVRELIAAHPDEAVLIFGTYVEHIRSLAGELGVPVLTGSTPQARRDELYGRFREGRVRVLAVSRVGNFAVDLPDAAVAIQVAGTFGSRQEEAQRLGRILRPKPGRNRAHFYTLVSRDTVEQEFALKRQLFLCEQGYEYAIRDEQHVEV